MTSLPPFAGPSLDAAHPEAPRDDAPSLLPIPTLPGTPASPFGLAIQQALSGPEDSDAEDAAAPDEPADASPASPHAGPCPAWACLIQIPPAPAPTPPATAAPAPPAHDQSLLSPMAAGDSPTALPRTTPGTPANPGPDTAIAAQGRPDLRTALKAGAQPLPTGATPFSSSARPPSPPPGWESPPTPVLPVVSAAISPWESSSPTARLDTAPADPGTGLVPAPATFAPPPGKNVTPPPVTGPILSPAKDGTNGAELTGVMTSQAETSTAQAETGRMLPTSGTGTVPAVSSSGAVAPGAGLAAEAARVPARETEAFRPETRLEQPAALLAHPVAADRLALQEGTADVPESAAPAPSPAATLERLEVQLGERVVEFRERRLDTLSVVLRPDAGTELHLQLRLQGDQIEVLAHCARGDAAGLQSQWHQLQQSLAGQGVRLAGLETGAGDSRRQPAPQPPPSEPAGVPALASVPRTGPTLPARPTLASRRLLESWA